MSSDYINDKRDLLSQSGILITGGTGSFGKHFLRYILTNREISRVVIYSRDELKQQQMKHDNRFNTRTLQHTSFKRQKRNSKWRRIYANS